MGGFTAQFVGLKELDEKLAQLKGDAAKRIVRRALMDGGEVIQRAIDERAPERPELPSGTALPVGALKEDTVVSFGRNDEGLPAAIIGPGKATAHVARFVEYGHRLVKGHSVSAARKLAGRGSQIGDVQAYPYIRPAYEASRAAAVEATIQSIRNGIEQEAAKK